MGHMTSVVKKHRTWDAGAQLVFFFYLLRVSAYEELPAFRVGLPASVKAFWKHAQRHTESPERFYIPWS